MLGIIDYQAGNMGSWKRLLKFIGCEFDIIKNKEDLDKCSKIILPGVGSFDSAIVELKRLNIYHSLSTKIKAGIPILGVCLGMQLLCESSEEGKSDGLSLISAKARSLSSLSSKSIVIPHMGFNNIFNKDNISSEFLLSANNSDFYFLHSFCIQETNSLNAECLYCEYEDIVFIAAFQIKNIYSTQFHPEKSGEIGISLVRTFINA